MTVALQALVARAREKKVAKASTVVLCRHHHRLGWANHHRHHDCQMNRRPELRPKEYCRQKLCRQKPFLLLVPMR